MLLSECAVRLCVCVFCNTRCVANKAFVVSFLNIDSKQNLTGFDLISERVYDSILLTSFCMTVVRLSQRKNGTDRHTCRI